MGQNTKLTFISNNNFAGKVQIYSLTGAVLQVMPFNAIKGENQISIPVNNLKKGVYILTLSHGEQVIDGGYKHVIK